MAIIYETSIEKIDTEQCIAFYESGTSVIFNEGKHVTLSTEEET